MVNQLLRAARKKKRWTIAVAAEKARVSELTYSRWEKGTQKPYLSTLDQLCEAYGMTPQELGFSQLIEEPLQETPSDSVSSPLVTSPGQNAGIITLTGDQATALLSLLGDDMKQFDAAKRATLQQLLKSAGAIGATLAMPQSLSTLDHWQRLTSAVNKPAAIDVKTLEYFSGMNKVCWSLTNGSEVATIGQLLATYLPQLTTLANQSSTHQVSIAALAAQGYLLAGLVQLDEYNLSEMEKTSQFAVQYSQLAEDYNLQAAAFKQQATMFLIARKTAKALQAYQKTLPFIDQVSPLLRSRIYQGLASASARCGQEKDALRYLGLARDTFPSDFLNDPSYLFADSGHMYEGLTLMDLNKPKDAWDAFAKVDGLVPKIPIGEFTRLEFLNLQAKSAVALRDIELCETYLEKAVMVATSLNSQYGNGDAFDVYRSTQMLWPDEQKVKSLGELFYS
jgi:DNA-binding XRE family transcriptional regulator/tetratricopeptide (TPR) repeat protein